MNKNEDDKWNNKYSNLRDATKKLKNEIDRIKLIDEYGVDGDFIESQAFAYLAIRSYLQLPILAEESS